MISFVFLCLLMGAGHLLRVYVKPLQKLQLPSCIIAGFLGLIVLQVLAAAEGAAESTHPAAAVAAELTAPWKFLPEALVCIVFACFFLGKPPPKFSTMGRDVGAQVLYGQMLVWGEYVVAVALWIAALAWLFPQFPAMFAGILPVGFAGGHGTAAGMAPAFTHFGWADGREFGFTSATFGMVTGLAVGMMMIYAAVRRSWLSRADLPTQTFPSGPNGVIPAGRRPRAGELTINSDVLETLSLQVVAVGAAVAVGYLIKYGLVLVETAIPILHEHHVLSGFPVFPLCMIGGLVVQLLEDRFDKHRLIEAGLIRRIQNASVDFLVVAAIATIEFSIVVRGLVPLTILMVAGIAWNVFCLLLLARRMFPDAWFERGIVELGQAMGVTATGLLLLRVVDPDYETPAANAFACKQIVHVLFIGWTSAAIPLLAVVGPWPVLLVSSLVVAVCLVVGLWWGGPHGPGKSTAKGG